MLCINCQNNVSLRGYCNDCHRALMYGAGPAIMPGKALGEKMTDAEFNAGTLVFLDAFSTAHGVGPIFMESFHFIGVEEQIS